MRAALLRDVARTWESGLHDTTEAIERRLELYEEQTAPLVAYYDDHDILVTVDGVGEVDEVFARVVKAVDAAVAP